jgi:pantothenate synthetase
MRVEGLTKAGERDASKLLAAGREEVAKENAVRLDYFEIVDPDTLDPVEHISGGALVAIAAYVGSTRLIDNILLDVTATTRPAK